MGNPFSNSSGSPPPTTQQLGDLYKAYTQFLPGVAQVTNNQTLPTALSNFNANLATTPLNNALNLQQLQQYALPTANVEQAVQRSNALAGANTNLAQTLGAGGANVLATNELNRLSNPNYTANADASARQSVNALNAINLNGLAPGEQNAVERSLNQSNNATGNLGVSNATNDVANAMNFGGAFNNKIGILNNTLGTASGVGNMLQNNGLGQTSAIALGQPAPSTASTFGAGTFGPNGQQAGSSAQSTANQFLGGANQIANTQLGAQATSNYQNSPQGSFVANSGACCFIFMEAYHGEMPVSVRKCRDAYYTAKPQIANGYKRMAKWLVPLMRHSRVIRQLVWSSMIQPLTEHAEYVTKHTYAKHRTVRNFWFTVWNYLGK